MMIQNMLKEERLKMEASDMRKDLENFREGKADKLTKVS